MRYSSERRLNDGESLAIATMETYKQAALLFDKIYIPHNTGDEEIDVPIELTVGIGAHNWAIRDRYEKQLSRHRGEYERQRVCMRLALRSVFPNAVLLFPTLESAEEEKLFALPEQAVYQIAISDLLQIDASKTEWKQVQEFRKDEESLENYKRFARFSRTLSANTHQEVVDILELRLEKYEWAIRKHGFETKIGGLSSVLGWDKLASIGVAGIGGTFFNIPGLAEASAGLVLAGHVGLWVAERKLASEAIKQGDNSEVALIYEAKSMLNKNA